MRKSYAIRFLVLCLLLVGSGAGSYAQTKRVNAEGKELTPVDIKSKRTRPVPVGDTTGYALTGDVVLYHNGAVITCDSMVRYSEKEMTCFGNVIIKKEDTYIYGDRAEYSRDKGEARIYSPLVKVLNKDATLYTYNLVFNTADNVGRFYGGGTFTNGQSLMESERGYFFADFDEVVGVDRVEMKNETYQMKSDSVNYNSESEVAKYFTRSVTWKEDGEILSSENGEYHNKDQRYIFRENAYILSDKKEMWADTLDYREMVQFIELKHNAQIRDEQYQSIIFGNYGNYSHATGDTFLTDDPAYMTFGDSDGNGVNDTVYMRSDSMYVYLIDSMGYFALTRPDSATLASQEAKRLKDIEDKRIADSLAVVKAERDKFVADSLAQVEQMQRQALLDSLYTLRASYVAMEQSDSIATLSQRLDFVIDSLETPAKDTTAVVQMVDSLVKQKKVRPVEPATESKEEVQEPAVDTLPKNKTTNRVMLGLRNVKVFRKDFQGICDSLLMFSEDSTAQLHKNSVMWNELNQITSERADVYTRQQKPYKVIFTGGKPIMSSEIDTTRYNQVAGKTIEALFNDGVMYRTDIKGNAQTLYYMVDDADGALMGFLVAESADMTFYIIDQTVDGIMYRGDPVYTIYPMTKIPADQPQRMPEFVWHIAEKPTAESIMGDWLVNPSERKRYQLMPKPRFPITYGIERQRESLVASGRWADRTDDISDIAKDFIERVKDK